MSLAHNLMIAIVNQPNPTPELELAAEQYRAYALLDALTLARRQEGASFDEEAATKRFYARFPAFVLRRG